MIVVGANHNLRLWIQCPHGLRNGKEVSAIEGDDAWPTRCLGHRGHRRVALPYADRFTRLAAWATDGEAAPVLASTGKEALLPIDVDEFEGNDLPIRVDEWHYEQRRVQTFTTPGYGPTAIDNS
jgi:hypothetical protein